MKEYALDIKIEEPFGNLFRKEHTLLVVLDNDNKVLVGLKSGFLPEGVPRLLGGGVKKEEEPLKGALRELNEELGVLADEKDLEEIFKVRLHAVDSKNNEYNTITYVYLYKVGDLKYQPGDDVTEIVRLSLDELKELANTYKDFAEDFWYEGVEGKHRWIDYGKLYHPIHMWTYEHLSSIV